MSDQSSQTAAILAHLQDGKAITPLEALRLYKSFRLGARIHQLRKAGHDIETTTVKQNGKHFAQYKLRRIA